MYEVRLSEIVNSVSLAVTVETVGFVAVGEGLVGEGVVGVGLAEEVAGLGVVFVGSGVADVLAGRGLRVVLVGVADFVLGLTDGAVVVDLTRGAADVAAAEVGPADVGTADIAAIDMPAITLGLAGLVARVLGTAAIEEAAATWAADRLGAAPVLLLDAPQALTTTERAAPMPMRPNERVREELRIMDSGGRGATRPGHDVHYGQPPAPVQHGIRGT